MDIPHNCHNIFTLYGMYKDGVEGCKGTGPDANLSRAMVYYDIRGYGCNSMEGGAASERG